MKNKTKVEVVGQEDQCCLDIGDIGYIDGHVTAADGRPYAVVVSGHKIDLISIRKLKVITNATR